MSNDVHLAKVSKIHRSSDIVAKGAMMNHSRGRCAGLRFTGKGADLMDDMRQCDEEYLFGSISPRGGMPHLSSDLESPDRSSKCLATDSTALRLSSADEDFSLIRPNLQ